MFISYTINRIFYKKKIEILLLYFYIKYVKNTNASWIPTN